MRVQCIHTAVLHNYNFLLVCKSKRYRTYFSLFLLYILGINIILFYSIIIIFYQNAFFPACILRRRVVVDGECGGGFPTRPTAA